MASTILKRIYSSVDDKRIVLSNSCFARLHGVSSWNKLRVALRLSMTDFGANLGSAPEFSVGVCSGTSNIYKDSTTTHFVGMQTSGATWTRATSTPTLTRYTAGASGIRPMKRVGSTTTTGTSGGNGLNLCADPEQATTHRVLYFIDITKGSPNYTIGGFLWDFNTVVDVTAADFLAQAELASPSFSGHVAATDATIAANESDGTLNAINLYWDRTSPQIEISDIAVARLS